MNEEFFSQRPWLKGALELLDHAIYHYGIGTPADLRFAMIHTDNAVELAGRLYLKMETRLQDTLSPGEVKELERYFDKLMKHLSVQLALDNLTRSNVEYFHEIRNDLYHNGNGISVDPKIVASYISTATRLLEQMFSVKMAFDERVPKTDYISPIVTKTAGELPPELINANKRRFLWIKISEAIEDVIRLRYAVTGYQTEVSPQFRTKSMSFRPDLMARNQTETILIEIRNLAMVNQSILRELIQRKERIERELLDDGKERIVFRIHTNTRAKGAQSIIARLKKVGWEIEDWKTSLNILSQNGLKEKAQPVEAMINEYESLYDQMKKANGTESR